MSGQCDIILRHYPHDSHVVSELEHERTCPSKITAAYVVGQQAGVPKLVRCNIKSLLGGINFGFQVSSRPDTATRQFAATASELAYTGWQVLVGHVNLYVTVVFCTLLAGLASTCSAAAAMSPSCLLCAMLKNTTESAK